jgi:hypothetical protein
LHRTLHKGKLLRRGKFHLCGGKGFNSPFNPLPWGNKLQRRATEPLSLREDRTENLNAVKLPLSLVLSASYGLLSV